ncbi:response regulator [Cohnella caldifontis]|uniref:response regulator n=1 Tax=Cohnella caldifontis TaxID=3027471 RepID=UPI0023EA7FF3|nr:response regulator [Cohnella sp. YIM B05605]
MYNLMIVEDENKTRYSLKHYVPWKDWEIGDIFEAANGKQALDLAKEIVPDLVLTDIRMPEMDGVELAHRLHQDYPDIGVIMLSAYSDLTYLKSAMRTGAVDYLLKPIDMEELARAVRTAIGRIKAAEERNREKRLLARHLPELRERFFQRVLQNEYASDEEKAETSASLGFDPGEGRLRWRLVSFHFLTESSGGSPLGVLPQSSLTRRELLAVLQHAFRDFPRCEWITSRDSEWMALVADFPESAPSGVTGTSYTQSILDAVSAVREHFGIELSAKIGEEKTSFFRLSESVNDLKPVESDEAADPVRRAALDERQLSLVEEMKAYVKEHFPDDTMTVGDIAAHLNYTSAYVCMLFKKATGMTLNHYINLYRLRAAKELLRDPSLKLFEIATRVGYSNENYFSKVFKKYENMPPSEYARGMEPL